MTAIQHAYCENLDRVVTAQEARREFLAREATGRWNFLCPNPDCRAAKVRVSGVNYWRSASEEETYVAPHFRHHDEHLSGCQNEETITTEPVPPPGNKGSSGRGRSSKAGDLIDVFDPDDDEAGGGGTGAPLPPGVSGPAGTHTGRGGPRRDDRSADSKTSFIEDLVDMRNALRADLSENDFDKAEIKVKHHGRVLLKELFKHVKTAEVGGSERVLYGGCKLQSRRFGLGFKLKFLDPLNNHPVIVYVDKDRLADYRFRRSLLAVIDEAANYTYLTVYAWATIRWDEDRKQYEVVLKSLKHLAIYPGKHVA